MDTNNKNDNLPELNKNKSKKFVFIIYPENIPEVEKLSYDEKNQVINDLLNEYFNDKNKNKLSSLKLENTKNILKKTVITLVAIPLILTLISMSLHFTKKSYLDMQNKFEKLYGNSQSK